MRELSVMGFALAAGVGILLWRDPIPKPDPIFAPPDEAVVLARQALSLAVSSAWRWCDLGETLARANELEPAHYCFRRAVELAPHIAAILARAANFHIGFGDIPLALELTNRILQQSSQYDELIFQYYDLLVPDAHGVLAYIQANPRALRSYFLHVMKGNRAGDAVRVWQSINERGQATDGLAAAFIEFLIQAGRYYQAAETWASYMGVRAGDYLSRNLIFNGGFEFEPSGCPLDWTIRPLDGVTVERDTRVVREGHVSLKIRFLGTANLHYSHIRQKVWAPHHRLRLAAWIRTQELTTDEGVRLRVVDISEQRLLAQTEPLRGTNDWQRIEVTFMAPPRTGLLVVEICRLPSRKFDNKISGTAWLDGVRLEPVQ